MNEEKLKAIISFYGEKNQKRKAIEELVELTELLIKDVNKDEFNKDDLYSEVADVEIMLEQIKMIYKINDYSLAFEINKKLNRTLSRMKEENPKDPCDGCVFDDGKHLTACMHCKGMRPVKSTDCSWK